MIECDENPRFVRDCNGVALSDGDSVIVVGEYIETETCSGVNVATKVFRIRLVEYGRIEGKIDGIGWMKLKSEDVRKA